MASDSWEAFRDSYGTAVGYLQRGYLDSGSPVPSNIPPLDSLLCGGYRPGLHVLGGEPGSGKSAFGLFVSMMGALSGARVMFASLEMGRAQCMARCLSFLSLGTSRPFRWGDVWRLAQEARGRRTDAMRRGEAMAFAEEFMASDPVALAARSMEERCPGLLIAGGDALRDVAGIEGAAAKGRAAGLDMLVVDYLQYLSCGDVADEYARVSAVSRRLNVLGTDLGMPVLALASCSRAGNRAGAPDMHAFKGSGDIEYHALSAAVIDRDPDGDAGTRRLHVVKNRFGAVTDAATCLRLRFDGAHNSFELA